MNIKGEISIKRVDGCFSITQNNTIVNGGMSHILDSVFNRRDAAWFIKIGNSGSEVTMNEKDLISPFSSLTECDDLSYDLSMYQMTVKAVITISSTDTIRELGLWLRTDRVELGNEKSAMIARSVLSAPVAVSAGTYQVSWRIFFSTGVTSPLKSTLIKYTPTGGYELTNEYSLVPGSEIMYTPSLEAKRIQYKFSFFSRGLNDTRSQYATYALSRTGAPAPDPLYFDYRAKSGIFGYLTLFNMYETWSGSCRMRVHGRCSWVDPTAAPTLHESTYRDGASGSWMAPAYLEIIEY